MVLETPFSRLNLLLFLRYPRLFGYHEFRKMTSCKMVFGKFLKNEQSYRKNTWNTLPLFFEDLKLFSWTFLSITNSLAKIWKNSSKKSARDTKKFHLWRPAPQTMGSIRKLYKPYCSLQSTEQIICPSKLCGVNIFGVTSFFLSEWRATKILANFNKNSIFFM